jgi:hypothetical protein
LNGFLGGDSDVLDYVQDDLSGTLWIWKGEVYNLSYVLAEGQCLPLMTHNWGFSFLGLFIVMFFTAVWSIGMYVMWLDAYLNSRFSRANRDLGTYRASLGLCRGYAKGHGRWLCGRSNVESRSQGKGPAGDERHQSPVSYGRS